MKAYQAAAIAVKSPRNQIGEIWLRLGPDLGDLATRFVALAERYPKDPAAMDALMWVVEKTMSASDEWESRVQQGGRPGHGDPRSRPCRRSSTGPALSQVDRL